MVDVQQQHASRAPGRNTHPVMLQLVGGIELNHTHLKGRPDANTLGAFAQMLANAEYWLSFDLAAFEPLLAKSPSPLRELGVAVTLRFGEGLGGELSLAELERAREILCTKLAEDLRAGVETGLRTLERAVRARELVSELEGTGFRRYQASQALSVHALRAMGRSSIRIDGVKDETKRPEVQIGEQLVLSAVDERGRPLPPPEVESPLDAPLYARDDKEAGKRTIVLLVPGEYGVRVPGRATGERKLIAI